MRPRLTLLVTALLALCVSQLFSPTITQACTCGRGLDGTTTPTPREEAARYDVVFTGKVLSIAGLSETKSVLLQVDKGWKGVSQTQVKVHAKGQEHAVGCIVRFEVGKSYIVHAKKDSSGNLDVWPCSPTRSISNAGDILQGLGPGQPPTQQVYLDNSDEIAFGLRLAVAIIIIWSTVSLIKKSYENA